MKTRVGLTLGFTVFLCLHKIIENLPGGKNIYSVLAIPVFLLSIIFWVTILMDVVSNVVNRLKIHVKQREYEKYILDLSGKKLKIIRNMYQNSKHQGYLSQNDTDVLELTMNHVIVSLKAGIIIGSNNWPEDLNDPPFLYVLQPEALKVIEKHKNRFK